jgi:protein-S-isoprenylcysteine O-methyltransferase Ste14
LLFRTPANIPGWTIAIFGFFLFLIAFTSMLKKKNGLLTSGLYGKVRHPQYLGFIVMTWGISAVSIIWKWGSPFTPHPYLPYFFCNWIAISLAYVGLAFLEERYLLKKHPQEYNEYKEKVPFLFPVPHPKKIPQPISDLGIIILFYFVLQEIYPRIIQILI